MVDLPKIRILWIDDRERVSGYPEKTLPTDLSRLFEVIHPASSDSEVMSFTSASEFMHEFKSFWFEHKLQYLPVEIIAADYNLKKRAAASRGQSKPMRELKVCDDDDETSGSVSPLAAPTPRRDEVDFDGLLIGAFYATLTYRYPSALVSITNYLGSMPSEVETLHELATPFLSIATKKENAPIYKEVAIWHNLIATERSWKNIVNAALPPLRNRISYLYNQGLIVIPPCDLINIMNENTSGAIRIASPHAIRALPTEGLFWDKVENPQNWAQDLLESKITRDRFISAEKLAKTIWSNYNDDVLMEQYALFSTLHVKAQYDTMYISLKNKFGLRQTGRGDNTYECSAQCSDIKCEEVTCETKVEEKNIRRWAAILLIRLLLKRILLFMENTSINSITRDGEKINQSLFPTFEEDDIFLLLYPIPSSPFPLPWHIVDARERDNKKGGWRKWMKDNLAFQPKDILAGSGLSTDERQILKGIVLADDVEFGDDPEARLERWKSYEPARLFLFGPDTVAGKNEDR